MKIKSLLIFSIAILVSCASSSYSYQINPLEENEFDIKEPSLEDTLEGQNLIYFDIPDYMIAVLKKNNLVPWETREFVHSCVESHDGLECYLNGLTLFISIIFVDKDDITNENSAEVLFNQYAAGVFKAYKLIKKTGNRFEEIGLKKETKI